MAKHIFLATYVIKLRKKRDLDFVFLSRFNEEGKDFLSLFKEFLHYRIGNHFKGGKDKEGRTKSLYFRGEHMEEIDPRTFHGFVHSGLAGDRGNVVDDITGEDLYVMEENHAKILPTYFFIHIPQDRKYGYIILQKKSNYGIKGLLEEAIQDFFEKMNLDFILEVNNFLVSLVFEKMLKVGKVLEMSFIKNQIPDHIEDLYDNGSEHLRLPGKTVTTVSTNAGLPVKGLLTRLYYSNQTPDGMVEIPEMKNEKRFDEVDFEMEYNGTKKTFHMKNIKRTLPDFNVTEHIDYDEEGLPTYKSLYGQCIILLNDMKEYHEPKT